MIKFGSFIPQGFLGDLAGCSSGREFEAVKDVALRCEALGFDSIWVYDHFITFPATAKACLESWTILSALATLTKKVGLGQLVTCNSYRYPSVLAKMGATLDVISNGRLNLGIGAGWYKLEYDAYGVPYPKDSVRIAQLREAVQIIKKMWTEDEPSFHGQYYTMEKAINSPKPVQKPHPPILIGGAGKKLTLRVVAELADRCNFGGPITPQRYKELLEVLDEHCRKVGRKIDQIEKTLIVDYTIIAKNKTALQEKIRKFKPKATSKTQFTEGNLVGTPEQIISRIEEFIDVGVTYIMMRFPDMMKKEPLQVFADKVIPAFR
jgi:F420-dependent oxidoreductase-like protein